MRMTKLGAILVLTQIKKAHETMPKFIKRLNEKMAEERIEALELAIESLSAEPNGDFISREDAIEAVTNLCVDGYKAKVDGYFIPLTDALINTLSELPSADQPQGEDWDKYSEKLWRLAYERGQNDRPSGDVNAVEIYEQAERELERGQITLGDFEERIKPLKHLNYSVARPKGEPEPETAPVVAYICDRRRCAICRGEDGGCDHTTDIKHAAHFKNVAGQYFERPYMEEDDG